MRRRNAICHFGHYAKSLDTVWCLNWHSYHKYEMKNHREQKSSNHLITHKTLCEPWDCLQHHSIHLPGLHLPDLQGNITNTDRQLSLGTSVFHSVLPLSPVAESPLQETRPWDHHCYFKPFEMFIKNQWMENWQRYIFYIWNCHPVVSAPLCLVEEDRLAKNISVVVVSSTASWSRPVPT